MSGLSAWIWGTSQLDDAVDRATSELLPSGGEDIALNLEICDQIRSKSVPAKDAMRALKRRLNHKNPNVQLLALGLTDICVKNGGDQFLIEIASREFIDNLVSILKIPTLNHDVKNGVLRNIQNWSIAFEGKSNLSYVGQVYKTLQKEGYKFPPKDLVLANSAMVDTQTAPEWIDSDLCLRCRTPFSFTNRKHHCRNCGQVFDQACSSKSMALPHFGIAQEVRVCDGCYNTLSKKAERADRVRKPSTAKSHRHRSGQELADAELQRAIQLSLEEVNANGNGHARPGYTPAQPPKWAYSEPPIVDHSARPSTIPEDEEDPDLRAAIEASLREANAPKPSAPIVETPRSEQPSYSYPSSYQAETYSSPAPSTLPKLPNHDLESLEADVIMTFNQTVDQLQAQGGRDLSRYPAVTDLYEKASGLRPKLALSLDDAGRKEEMLSEMHGKLSEAVKLYDQILTQQISQPRWRSAVSPAPYQPQWAPQAPVSQPAYQTPAQSYATSSTAQEPQYYQQQAYQQQASLQPVTYGTAPIPAPPQQYQSFASPPQTLAYNQLTPSSTVQSTPNLASAPMLPQSPPPPLSHHTPALSPSLGRSSTVSYSGTPASPTLARSNTFASRQPITQPAQYQQQPQYQPSAPTPAPVSAPPPPPQQQQQQQQYRPAYQVASPPSSATPSSLALLQQLPSPPTTVPQSNYNMYAPSMSPGFEQKEERKEAMLIDL